MNDLTQPKFSADPTMTFANQPTPREGHKQCPRCGSLYDVVASYCQKDGAVLVLENDTPDPYIGQVLLQQFKIEEQVGAGGMGTVYRAHQKTLDRDVAIKILHPELVRDRDAVQRFRREARVTTSLEHPNVVNVFLFGQLADKNLYLVMEYLEGRSLIDVLAEDGPLTLERALHIAIQICSGIGEAHHQGVIHRDVKPENVILVSRAGDDDFVKVVDFGIARFLSGESTATKAGLVFGTARYISPEAAEGLPTDTRSDVYSIGTLAYQLLCGETPFDSPSPVALLMQQVHESPPDLRDRARGDLIPDPIADVIMQAIEKDPDARFATASEMAEALTHAALEADVDLQRYKTRPSNTQSRSRIKPPAHLKDKSQSQGSQRRASRPQTNAIAPPAGQLQHSETLASAPSPVSNTTSITLPRQPIRQGASPYQAQDERRDRGMPWWAALLALLGLVAIGIGVYALREAQRQDATSSTALAEPTVEEAVDPEVTRAEADDATETEEGSVSEEAKPEPSHGTIVVKPDPPAYGKDIEFIAIPTIETRNDQAVRLVIRDDSGWRRTIETTKNGTHYEGSRSVFRSGRYTVALEGFEPALERSFTIERPRQQDYEDTLTVTRTWDRPTSTSTNTNPGENTAVQEPDNINWGSPKANKGASGSQSGESIDWTVPE